MKIILSSMVAVAIATAVPACAARAQTADSAQLAATAAGPTPHRVYDTKRRRFVDLESMTAVIAAADVAFLGELHNDPGTHLLQAAVLEGIGRWHSGRIVLSLEMFERDAQPLLDRYLVDSIPEGEFLSGSRPWPNYASDYRPMVELAKARAWPVVAANIPRRLASAVARGGLGVFDSLPSADRQLTAVANHCPRDEYWRRFQGVMGDMSGHGMQLSPEQVEAMVWRTYEAQCVKDEAMAEAVVRAREAYGALVVHVNGAFHSNYRLGTVARVTRRAPRLRTVVVTFTPVPDLDVADGRAERQIGDYIVYTLAPPADSSATP